MRVEPGPGHGQLHAIPPQGEEQDLRMELGPGPGLLHAVPLGPQEKDLVANLCSSWGADGPASSAW